MGAWTFVQSYWPVIMGVMFLLLVWLGIKVWRGRWHNALGKRLEDGVKDLLSASGCRVEGGRVRVVGEREFPGLGSDFSVKKAVDIVAQQTIDQLKLETNSEFDLPHPEVDDRIVRDHKRRVVSSVHSPFPPQYPTGFDDMREPGAMPHPADMSARGEFMQRFEPAESPSGKTHQMPTELQPVETNLRSEKRAAMDDMHLTYDPIVR